MAAEAKAGRCPRERAARCRPPRASRRYGPAFIVDPLNGAGILGTRHAGSGSHGERPGSVSAHLGFASASEAGAPLT
jgi:hypothetical protein